MYKLHICFSSFTTFLLTLFNLQDQLAKTFYSIKSKNEKVVSPLIKLIKLALIIFSIQMI